MVVLRYTKKGGISDHHSSSDGVADRDTATSKKQTREDSEKQKVKTKSSKKKSNRYSTMVKSKNKQSSSNNGGRGDSSAPTVQGEEDDERRKKKKTVTKSSSRENGRRHRSLSATPRPLSAASTRRSASHQRHRPSSRSRGNTISPPPRVKRQSRSLSRMRHGDRDRGVGDHRRNDRRRRDKQLKEARDTTTKPRSRSSSSMGNDRYIRNGHGHRLGKDHRHHHRRNHHHRHHRHHHDYNPRRGGRDRDDGSGHGRRPSYDDDDDDDDDCSYSSYSSSSSSSTVSASSSSTKSSDTDDDDVVVQNRHKRSPQIGGHGHRRGHRHRRHDDGDENYTAIDSVCSSSSSSSSSSASSTSSSSLSDDDVSHQLDVTRSVEDDDGLTQHMMKDTDDAHLSRDSSGDQDQDDDDHQSGSWNDDTVNDQVLTEREDDEHDDVTIEDVDTVEPTETRDDGDDTDMDGKKAVGWDGVEDDVTTHHDRYSQGDDKGDDKLRDIGRVVRASDLSDFEEDYSRSLDSGEKADFELFMKEELKKETMAKQERTAPEKIKVEKHRKDRPSKHHTADLAPTPAEAADAVLWMLGLKKTVDEDDGDGDDDSAANSSSSPDNTSDDVTKKDDTDAEYTEHTRTDDFTQYGDQSSQTSHDNGDETTQDKEDNDLDDVKSRSGWTWTVNFMGGASIAGSYGGLRDGEVLIPGSGVDGNATVSSGESSSMRGSDSHNDLSSRDETCNDHTTTTDHTHCADSVTANSSGVETTQTKNTARNSSEDTLPWFGVGGCCSANPSDFSTVASPNQDNDKAQTNDISGIQGVLDTDQQGFHAEPPTSINSSALKRPRESGASVGQTASNEAGPEEASSRDDSETVAQDHEADDLEQPVSGSHGLDYHGRISESYHSHIEVSDCDSMRGHKLIGYTNSISTNTRLPEQVPSETNAPKKDYELWQNDVHNNYRHGTGNSYTVGTSTSRFNPLPEEASEFGDSETHFGNATVANTEAATVFSADSVIVRDRDVQSVASDSFYDHHVDEEQSRKRAELLDEYNNAELLHGHRSRLAWVQKQRAAAAAAVSTRQVPVSRFASRKSFWGGGQSRRSRRQFAVNAHREFLYGSMKSQSTEQTEVPMCSQLAESRPGDNSHELTPPFEPDNPFHPVNDNVNSLHNDVVGNSHHENTTHSINLMQVSLKNSIMADDSVRMTTAAPEQTDAQKADDLVGLFQSALGAVFNDPPKRSPAIDIESVAGSHLPPEDKSAPGGIINAAFALFGITNEEIEEFERLGNRPVLPPAKPQVAVQRDRLRCTNFNPNPAKLPSNPEDCDSDSELEAQLLETLGKGDDKNVSKADPKSCSSHSDGLKCTSSDVAVKDPSRSAHVMKSTFGVADKTHADQTRSIFHSHRNLDNIPHELKPTQIWRAFDSFSIATNTSATVSLNRFDDSEEGASYTQIPSGNLSQMDRDHTEDDTLRVSNGSEYFTREGAMRTVDRTVVLKPQEEMNTNISRSSNSEMAHQPKFQKSTKELVHEKRAELLKLKSLRAHRQNKSGKPFRQLVETTRLDIASNKPTLHVDNLSRVQETVADKHSTKERNLTRPDIDEDDSDDEFFDATMDDCESEDSASPLTFFETNNGETDDEDGCLDASVRSHPSISTAISLD